VGHNSCRAEVGRQLSRALILGNTGPDQPLSTLEASLSGATNGGGDVRLVQPSGSGWRYSGGGYTVLQGALGSRPWRGPGCTARPPA